MVYRHAHIATALATVILAALLPLVAAEGRVKIKMISFGDAIENKTWVRDWKPDYNSKARIEERFRQLKDGGYTMIYWRMLWNGAPREEVNRYSYRVEAEAARMRKEFENTPYAWDPHELRWPVEAAHRLGMKFYAWIVPYDLGAPPGAWTEYSIEPYLIAYPTGPVYDTQYDFFYKFLADNPQYQLIDRKGQRYFYGVLEWAYPEARRYWTNLIKGMMDKYNVDGIYMDTRTECLPPDYADQFGFNEPIVQEYKRRYGLDIRQQDFDLESWRQLRGEYLSLLLKEMAEVIHSRGRLFSLGTARGDYLGFPLGNMKLEWRKWISEKMIDEFHLDEQGWALGGRHGYGYLTDSETGRGLQPIEVMAREAYGPLCRKYGVKLYFKPRLYPNKDQEWKLRIAGMPEFDGIIE